jgi:hypothetical protein
MGFQIKMNFLNLTYRTCSLTFVVFLSKRNSKPNNVVYEQKPNIVGEHISVTVGTTYLITDNWINRLMGLNLY